MSHSEYMFVLTSVDYSIQTDVLYPSAERWKTDKVFRRFACLLDLFFWSELENMWVCIVMFSFPFEITWVLLNGLNGHWNCHWLFHWLCHWLCHRLCHQLFHRLNLWQCNWLCHQFRSWQLLLYLLFHHDIRHCLRLLEWHCHWLFSLIMQFPLKLLWLLAKSAAAAHFLLVLNSKLISPAPLKMTTL